MEKIKYLYIFSGAVRNIRGFFKMVEEREDAEYHKFFVPQNDNLKIWVPELNAHNNIIYLSSENKLKQLIYMYKLFSSAEHIIIHGMFFGNWPLLVLLSSKKLLKKLSWIEWTGDVYLWKRPNNNLKNLLINFINKKIRQNIKFIVMSAPNDKERFMQEFDIKDKKILELSFPSNRNAKEELNRLKPQKYDDSCKMVQIGHNAYTFNKHIMILDMLAKFKNKNLKVVLPLTYGWSGLNGQYGSMTYMKAVIRYAKFLFKERALIFSKNIPLENYSKFLWNVDVAIFGLNRLAAASNIFMLLYMGKKVFFDGKSPHYKFFKEKGFDVYDLYDIPKMSYEDFIAPPNHRDASWLDDIYDNELVKNKWNEYFYRYLEKKGE